MEGQGIFTSLLLEGIPLCRQHLQFFDCTNEWASMSLVARERNQILIALSSLRTIYFKKKTRQKKNNSSLSLENTPFQGNEM